MYPYIYCPVSFAGTQLEKVGFRYLKILIFSYMFFFKEVCILFQKNNLNEYEPQKGKN